MRRRRASEIAALLHPRRSRWKTLAVIAFLDESGAHGGPNDVFTVGGWIAREKRWTRIDQIWDRQLGKRIFHMNHFENRFGQFKEWPRENRRVALISALADSLQGNEAFGTVHSLELEPFRRLMCPPKAKPHHVKRFAYGMLLTGCLRDIIFLFRPPANEQVSVICEECDGVEGFATEMFYDFKRSHRLADRLGTIAFMAKDAFRGLQAADMLAYEGFKHITNQVVKDEDRPVRKLFSAQHVVKCPHVLPTVARAVQTMRPSPARAIVTTKKRRTAQPTLPFAD